MAEDEGFEPPQTESESGVLPLHKSSISGADIIIRIFSKKSRTFFQSTKLFSGHEYHAPKELFYSPSPPNTAPKVLKMIFQSTQKLRS